MSFTASPRHRYNLECRYNYSKVVSETLRRFPGDLLTVPWAQEVLLLPEVQGGHVGLGIRVHQQYQKHPTREKDTKVSDWQAKHNDKMTREHNDMAEESKPMS